MVPRLRFDIEWSDLLRAAAVSIRGAPQNESSAREAIVTLSVRSAFDLLLSALALPQGSEVMLSEVTVPHMATIAQEHGLVPVGVPIDPRTLSIDVAKVAKRATDKTRLLMVAPLFGTRMPLDELGDWARERNILLVEDAAQALTSAPLTRDPATGASLYSFGPIKTATALGGGGALVKDDQLRDRMSEIATTWPLQSRYDYLARIAKISLLKLFSHRLLLTPLVHLVAALGGDADKFVGGTARGFPSEKLFAQLRKRPCVALTAMISHRLVHFDASAITERTRRGKELATQIEPAAFAAGCDNSLHTYWVFPAVCREPEKALAELRAAGIDATRHSGLAVVGDDSPDHWFRRVVFVPHHSGVSERMLERAAEIVRSTSEV